MATVVFAVPNDFSFSLGQCCYAISSEFLTFQIIDIYLQRPISRFLKADGSGFLEGIGIIHSAHSLRDELFGITDGKSFFIVEI